MSKHKVINKVKCVKECCSKDPDSFIFMLPDSTSEDNSSCEILELKHPHSGEEALFLLKSNKLFEIFSLKDPKRSYFIGQTVKSDGTFYITSPFDPLFLILPYLTKAQYCEPIDHILKDDDFPALHKLLECEGILSSLSLIADKKGAEDLNAFKYNEEKTLDWLSEKVQRTAKVLEEKRIHVGSNSVSTANYIRSDGEKYSSESYLVYAFGIVSDYLSEELKNKLNKRLNIPVEVEIKKRQRIETETIQEIKKSKIEENGVEQIQKKKIKSPVKSAKEKSKAKAASGSKNISSFFKKIEKK